MNFYLFFRKLHLYFTLLALAPLAIISVTGLLLLFETEITQLQADVPFKNDAQFVSSAENLEILHQHTEQLLEKNSLCKLNYIRHDVQVTSLPRVYLKCREGRIKFVVNLNTQQHYPLERDGFKLILDLHRTLLLGSVGQNIVGISTLIIIFNIVLGLVLWFIRGKKVTLEKKKFKIVMRPNFSLRHLHSVTALYLTPILLIVSLTGISWTWRDDIYQGLAFLQGKEQAMPVELTDSFSSRYDKAMNPMGRMASPRDIYKEVERNYPQYEILGLSPAKTPNDLLTVRLKEKDDIGFIPHLYVSLDAYSLEEKHKTDGWKARSEDSIYGYRIMQYGLHTGFFLGTLGKVIWAIFDILFIASILVLGMYLWLKRRKTEVASKNRSSL